jgi:hypothetical protein
LKTIVIEEFIKDTRNPFFPLAMTTVSRTSSTRKHINPSRFVDEDERSGDVVNEAELFCKDCEQTFTSQKRLENHVRIKHGIVNNIAGADDDKNDDNADDVDKGPVQEKKAKASQAKSGDKVQQPAAVAVKISSPLASPVVKQRAAGGAPTRSSVATLLANFPKAPQELKEAAAVIANKEQCEASLQTAIDFVASVEATNAAFEKACRADDAVRAELREKIAQELDGRQLWPDWSPYGVAVVVWEKDDGQE